MNPRILLGVFLISLTMFALIIPSAHAFGLIDWTGDVVLKGVSYIMMAIGYILGMILYAEGLILDWVLGLTRFSNSPVVMAGWTITRDLANMWFVLVMIFIAFTTILRIETYRTKELVAKLIIVALLINFSLVIGGLIIDFTQVITTFFLENAAGAGTISENLANGLKLSEIYQPGADGADTVDKLLNFGNTILLALAGMVFAVVFSGIAVFVFAAAILMFLARIIALWLLLIVAPIAWAASILPDTKHLWDKWWSQFLKWAFFAPVYSFFIYLALSIVSSGGLTGQFKTAPKLEGKASLAITGPVGPEKILDMVLIVAILIAGIKVAESFGAHGASAAMGYAKKGGVAARNYTGRMARRGAVATGAPQAIAKGLSRIPVLRQAARPLRRFEETERSARAKNIKDTQEKWKGATAQNTADEYRAAVDPQTKAGLLKALSEKKGGLELLNENETKDGLQTLKGYGMEGDILKTRPDLAPEVGKTVEDAVRSIKPSEIGNLSPKVVENPDVARFFNPGQLEAVFKEGMSDAFAKAFPKAVEKGIPAETKQIEYLQASPAWKNIIPEIAIKGAQGGAQPKETKGPSPITLAGTRTPLPPPGERK